MRVKAAALSILLLFFATLATSQPGYILDSGNLDRDAVTERGFEPVEFIPGEGWLVRKGNGLGQASIPSHKLKQLPTRKSDRLKSLEQEGFNEAAVCNNSIRENRLDLTVEFYSHRDTEEVRTDLEKNAVDVRSASGLDSYQVSTEKNLSRIDDLENITGVKWIDCGYSKPETLNDGLRAKIDVRDAYDLSVSGENMTAAEWDAGCAGNHTDLMGRVSCENNASIHYHSTHVAGTVVGNGTLNAEYRGVAPEGELVSFKWPFDGGFLHGVLDNETDYSIEKHGAVVSQNSWSSTTTDGVYDSIAKHYDQLVRGYNISRSITVVFSAGNSGDYGYQTIARWGPTAKNTITVGSTNSDTGEISGFSSRGPTADGRLKPEISAPGCQEGGDGGITSTYPGNNYNAICGTSMASPAVSGTIMLMHQKNEQLGGERLRPATDKAILVHTAEDRGMEGPDFSYGYGEIDAGKAVGTVEEAVKEDTISREMVSQGETFSRKINETGGRERLRFTVAWSDPPGSSGSEKQLVNDLDLVVEGPNGTHMPWVLNPDNVSEPASKGDDSLNNLEQVEINDPVNGTYTVKVNGTFVPEGPQNFSLVVEPSEEAHIVSPEEGYYTNRSIDFNVTAGDRIDNISYSIDGARNFTMKKDGNLYYNLSHKVDKGAHVAQFWLNDSGNVWVKERNFTVDETPPEFSNVSGDGFVQADSYGSLKATVLDNREASEALLATNETGEWENKSMYGSPVSLDGNSTVGFTWYNSSAPRGAIGWKIHARDSAGNWNSTEIRTFRLYEPSIGDIEVSQNGTLIGDYFFLGQGNNTSVIRFNATGNESRSVEKNATVNVTLPDGTIVNLTATSEKEIFRGYTYRTNLTLSQKGTYYIDAAANDTTEGVKSVWSDFDTTFFDVTRQRKSRTGDMVSIEANRMYRVRVNRSDLNWSYDTEMNYGVENDILWSKDFEANGSVETYLGDNWSSPGEGSWNFTNHSFEGSKAIAAKAGDGESAVLEMNFSPEDSGHLSFRYRTSSEHDSDYFRYKSGYYDTVEDSGWSGWKYHRDYFFGGENYTVRFTYDKDGMGSDYNDTVYVDRIRYTKSYSPEPDTGIFEFMPRNYGNYTVKVYSENRKGEEVVSETFQLFSNVTIEPEPIINPDYSYLIAGNTQLLSHYYNVQEHGNVSMTVSNSTWNTTAETSVNATPEEDLLTGEPYNATMCGTSFWCEDEWLNISSTVDINRSGEYWVNTSVENPAGKGEKNELRKFYSPVNLTFNVTNLDAEPVHRYVEIDLPKASSGDYTVNSTGGGKIKAPDITEFNDSYTIISLRTNGSVTRNVWGFRFQETTLNQSTNMTVDRKTGEIEKGDKILYTRIFNDPGFESNVTDLYYNREVGEIPGSFRDIDSAAIYTCGNYTVENDTCQTTWERRSTSSYQWDDELQLESTVEETVTNFAVGEKEYCGNGYCGIDESSSSCSADCGEPEDDPPSFSPSPPPEPDPEERLNVTSERIEMRYYDFEESETRKLDFTPLNTSTVVEGFSLTFEEDVEDFNLTIERRDVESVNRPETTVAERAFEISHTPVNSSLEAEITFQADDGWKQRHDLENENISLYRGIDSVKTVHVEENRFRSTLEMFSEFVVAGEKPPCYFSGEIDAASSDTCETFSNRCSVPEGYSEVRSCSIWEEEKEAEQKVEEVREKTDTDNAKEIVEKAESELLRGNYSGAEKLAEKAAEEEKKTESRNRLLKTVFAVLVLLISAAFLGLKYYRYRRKKSIESELAEISDIVADAMNSGRLHRDPEIIRLMERVRHEIRQGNTEKANNLMDELSYLVRENKI